MTAEPIPFRPRQLADPPDILIRLIEAAEGVRDATIVRMLDDDPDDESTWPREALLANLRAERKRKGLYEARVGELARMVVDLRERAARCTCGAFATDPPAEARLRAWPELDGQGAGL